MEKIISFGRRAHSYGVNIPKEELGATKFLNQNGHNSGLVQDRWNYFSIIKMNNTYLEMSDPSYATRGFGNMIMGYCFLSWFFWIGYISIDTIRMIFEGYYGLWHIFVKFSFFFFLFSFF